MAFTIFKENSILDVWMGSADTSETKPSQNLKKYWIIMKLTWILSITILAKSFPVR